MDCVSFQEKMDPKHRASLCRMIKREELPECLLEQYARVKMMLDRIDGFLQPDTMALIASIAGYDPETGKFEITGESLKELKSPKESETAKTAEATVDETTEQAVDESDDKAVDETVEQAVEQTVDDKVEQGPAAGPTEQAVAEPLPEEPSLGQPARSGKLWSLGMPVHVVQNGQLEEGKIVSVLHPPDPASGKPIQLTIELADGKTITVDEDEAEAV